MANYRLAPVVNLDEQEHLGRLVRANFGIRLLVAHLPAGSLGGA
jgi:hypothetical protein